jgi:hypothetical protein
MQGATHLMPLASIVFNLHLSTFVFEPDMGNITTLRLSTVQHFTTEHFDMEL